MKPAIQVENLSKEYQVASAQSGQYRTLRESLSGAAGAPLRALRRLSGASDARSGAPGTVSALEDVSLEVRPGEVVGVIGRNGAGKSTLLKIISQVTEPTAGRVVLRGRLASLLEVGTGFHQELTGRENIYLSGAILGMSKRDLARQFDAIVDFAEIGDYIDTPVKRYSSGMLVRLAFAVAAHLEPDILLLDEVLAVGDAGFRAKCIRRMKELISSNVAVLFVSHQRSQIADVCSRCVVLHKGRLAYSGGPESAWDRYVECLNDTPTSAANPKVCEAGGRLLSVAITDADEQPTSMIAAHEPLSINVDYELAKPFARLGIGINLHSGGGNVLADCTTFDTATAIPSTAGRHRVRLNIAGLPFAGGNYLAGVRLYNLISGKWLDCHFQRYPLVVAGESDHHAVRLDYCWDVESRSLTHHSLTKVHHG